jgi:drug/metabolite transporter (DMT)-like permease
MGAKVSIRDFYSGIGLAVLAALIWSGNYVIARGIYKQLPPVSLAFYRWAMASLCLAPFAWRGFAGERKIIYREKKYIIWSALTGVTIFNTLIYIAGHFTSAINLALIGTTSAPVFATILAVIFLKEPAGPLRIAGMVICFSGILFLLSGGNFQQLSQFRFQKGDLLMLVSAFTFAIYNTLVRKKPDGISSLVFLFAIFVLGTVFLAPFYLYELIHDPPVHWTMGIFLIVLYLGIGNSIISFLCWNESIKRLGASGTALFGNLIPVFSSVEAIFFLKEEFSRVHLFSGLLVIAGLVVANIRKPVNQTGK